MREHNTHGKPGIIGIFIFIAIFLGLYCLMNYYVLSSYYRFFSLSIDDLFFILLFALTISFLISTILEQIGQNIIFKITYMFSSIWMGTMFISLFVVSFFNILNFFKFSGITNFTAGLTSLSITLILVCYSIYATFNIRVKEFNIYNDKNANARIVHITDIHLGPVYDSKYLEKIVKKVNDINPDLVLMTGDLLDGRYSYNDDALKPLTNIKSEVYFVYGNHDEYAGLDRLKKLLSITKINWLRNESVHIAKNNLDIIGFDDNSDSKQFGGLLYSINMHNKIGSKFTILMAHRPVGWIYASKYVNLMLAGHTHAGQIWPFNYIAFLQNGASKGIYRSKENNKFMLYVSSGVGTWGPPMRLGSTTEITVFNIIRESTLRRSENELGVN